MDLGLIKAPYFIQMAYDKVTLPSPLLFITRLKGLFVLFLYLLSCVPSLFLMGVTGLAMSKAAKKG